MKNLIYTLTFLFVSTVVMAQTQTENYVKIETYQVKTQDGQTNENGNNLTDNDKIEAITYYDGLGRPKQSITKQAGGNGEDIITAVVYDSFGRQAREYLPFAGSSGSLDIAPNILPDANGKIPTIDSFYLNKFPSDLDANTPNPYSEKHLEASPLSRVLEQAAPGSDWAYDEDNFITISETNLISLNEEFSIYHSSFNNNSPGGGGAYISITNSELYVSFSGSWSPSTLKTGQIEFLDTSPYILPNITIGDLKDYSGNTLPYSARITDNYLVFDSTDPNFITTSLNCEFTIPLNLPLEEETVELIESANNTIRYKYTLNEMSDLVRHFEVDFPTGNVEQPELVDMGVFDPNELYKTVTRDENWQPGQQYKNDHITEEYKDKQGRIVLKRTFNKDKWHDTNYVYDDFDNLTYVLPPKLNTYHDLWQNEISSHRIDFNNNFDFYQRRHDSKSNNGNVYYNAHDRTLKFYLYDNYDNAKYNPNAFPINVTFKEEETIMETYLGTDLPELTLTGTISYFDEYRISRDQTVSATIINNELLLNPDFPNVVYGFTMTLSVSLDGANITMPDITSTDLDGLAYQYRYDDRNRLVEKKIPGKDWEYIVYDKQDRPVGTQDANLRSQNKWLFTKYDAFGRVAYTGIKNVNWTRDQAQSNVNTFGFYNTSRSTTGFTMNGLNVKYVSSGWPDNFDEVLTVNYYDDYDVGLDSDLEYQDSYGQQLSGNSNTLATVSEVRVLDTNHWTTTVTYYDEKARPIFTAGKNGYLNTYDWTKIKLDFVGNTLETQSHHEKNSGTPVVITDTFTYDHQNRLLTQTRSINGSDEELIVNNHYDELGQLESKNVGGTVATLPEQSVGLQTVDYTYNIRGWLKNINDPTYMGNDLFSFGLNYNDPQGPSISISTNKPLYNGNISHVNWKTDNVDNGLRHYSYLYDAMNRFEKAYFAENDSYNSKFNTYVYGYDRNGNIDHLSRTMQNPNNPDGLVNIDNLQYAYDGNRLMEVTDSYGLSSTGVEGFKDGNTVGDDHAYDANGNMTIDKNKGITNITYNHLNLPTKVVFNNNDPIHSATWEAIEYAYDATGTKLSKTVKEGGIGNHTTTTTEYAGSYVYENGALKFFNHPEGYIEPDGTGNFDYIYQYKDHLGNIRLSYMDMDQDGNVTGASSEIFFDDFETASGWDGSGASWGWPISGFDSCLLI